MKTPIFLTLIEVLKIHDDQINRYSGYPGVRDIGLLQSAIAMPTVAFGGAYLHSDIYEMAAAYVFHIVKNHPFVDGNKRTGMMSAFVFLETNGIEITAEEDKFEEIVLATVEGKMDKTSIAAYLRANSIHLSD